MIEELLAAGVPRSGIVVLVATGLHRPNEGDELARVIGDDWVLGNVRVENHFARDAGAHANLGVTATRGTPAKLDRRLVEADLRIATGLVEPHFMAGYSGGRKVVVPGVAHEDTIRTLHNARFMGHPAATQANLDGNPLHKEQLEIVRMLGDVYALNVVIDEERRLSFVNFGEIVASHLAAVEFAHRHCTVSLPRRFSTVVTSAAGYPLDQTYYQTVKGMVTPMGILEDDGTLIVASACTEGFRLPGLPGRPGAADAARSRPFPAGHRSQDAGRHRRVADANADEAAGDRHRPALHGGARRGGARAHRCRRGGVGARGGRRQRRAQRRPGRGRHPGGTVRSPAVRRLTGCGG